MFSTVRNRTGKRNTEFDTPTLCQALCPACGNLMAAELLNTEQPLATLAWPTSEAEAKELKKLPLKFVQCLKCTHVFNAEFDADDVPYSTKPNNMFNLGKDWRDFIANIGTKLLTSVPKRPTVVEIGHGDGSFLRSFQSQFSEGEFHGFDPNGSAQSDKNLTFHSELFLPLNDLSKYQPDIIVSRHVLEHMNSPLGFLQSLSIACAQADIWPLIYIEVPCVDRMLKYGRVADLYYEHCSQFTTQSFSMMLRSANVNVIEIGHGYNWEVIYCLAQAHPQLDQLRVIEDSQEFKDQITLSNSTIRSQLFDLIGEGRTVAIWGGTGKGAAFINYYGLSAEFFPTIVDSDDRKVGTYVPGTGQVIQHKDCLKSDPPNYIFVPAQWRAKDILAEIKRDEIPFECMLIEHDGRLVDFERDEHAYH